MSEHSHKTVSQLRNELNWWTRNKKALRLSEDERRTAVSGLEAELARRPRGPGRPVGYRVSDETKKKISRTRKEGSGLKAAIRRGDGSHNDLIPPPQSTHPETSFETRREVWIRDEHRCRGCHAWSYDNYYDKAKKRWKVRYRSEDAVMVVHVDKHAEPNDAAALITLCRFCRDMVYMGGLTMIGISAVTDAPRPETLVGGVGGEYVDGDD